MVVSFCVVLFPRDVFDEFLDLIESFSEGFPTYSPLQIGADPGLGVVMHSLPWASL